MRSGNFLSEEFRALQRQSAAERLLVYRVYRWLAKEPKKQQLLLRKYAMRSVEGFWELRTIVPLIKDWARRRCYSRTLTEREHGALKASAQELRSRVLMLGETTPILTSWQPMLAEDRWACATPRESKVRIMLGQYLRSSPSRSGRRGSCAWTVTRSPIHAERAVVTFNIFASRHLLITSFENVLERIYKTATEQSRSARSANAKLPFEIKNRGKQNEITNEDLQAAMWIKRREGDESPWKRIFEAVTGKQGGNLAQGIDEPRNLARDMTVFDGKWKADFRVSQVMRDAMIQLVLRAPTGRDIESGMRVLETAATALLKHGGSGHVRVGRSEYPEVNVSYSSFL